MTDARISEPDAMDHRTTSQRSGPELSFTRTFDAPVRRVYEAWTTAASFRQWWVPASSGAVLLSCEQDVRVGGTYRLVFAHPRSETPMAFFGTYLDVVPQARLAWTNEESDNGAVTTVTFAEADGGTLLVMRERYPSKEVLDASTEGMEETMAEIFTQLDAFLVAHGAGADGT